jgi:uncharacterized membrane protein YkoI
MMTDQKSLNKKVAATAVATVLAIAAVGLVVLSPLSVLGQNSTNTTTTTTANNNNLTTTPTIAPNITGSVNIQKAINDFLKNNVKVTFADAANIAKGQVPNGVVVAGGFSDVHGFLTYTFGVAKFDAGTMKMVIVDAGNGQVLLTSNDFPLHHGGLLGGGPGGGAGWGTMHHHGLDMCSKNPSNGMTSGTTTSTSAGVVSA